MSQAGTRVGDRASRVAGVLAWATGLGFGPLGVYGTIHFAKHGEIWRFMGFPTYGDGPFERIGIPTSVTLLTGFVAVCAAEVVVGSMLWANKPGARRLSVGLLPLELAYWAGFALPGGLVLGVLRTTAVVASHAGRFRAVNSSVLDRGVRFRGPRRRPRPGP